MWEFDGHVWKKWWRVLGGGTVDGRVLEEAEESVLEGVQLGDDCSVLGSGGTIKE